MDNLFILYLLYLAISAGLTVWVATTLSRHGRVFLNEIFEANEALASAVNHLLVVGFYLINFGWMTLVLKSDVAVDTPTAIIEVLSTKIGTALLVLGGMHFMNLLIFSRIRAQRHTEQVADQQREIHARQPQAYYPMPPAPGPAPMAPY